MNGLAIAKYADGVEALTALASLTTPVLSPPQAPYSPYAEYVDLGNVLKWGNGSPSSDWNFPIIDVNEAVQLADYCPDGCALVYINTPDQFGVYHSYLASMVWPLDSPVIKAGMMENLDIHFDIIEEAEEPS